MIHELNARLAIWIALGLGLGVAVQVQPWNGILVLLILTLVRRIPNAAVLLVSLAIGYLAAPQRASSSELNSSYFQGSIRVASIPQFIGGGWSFVGESDRGERYVVSVRSRFDLALWDQIQVMGRREPLSEASERRWLDRNIRAQLIVKAPPEVEKPGPLFWRWAQRLRKDFSDFTQRILSPDRAALLDALCFNDRSELSVDRMERLTNSGLTDLLASSGVKVFLLLYALRPLMDRLWLPVWTKTALKIVILVFFAALCGFSASSVRAVFMAILYLLSSHLSRSFDALSALSWTFVGSFAVDPACVFDQGLHLSFVGLIGICTLSRDLVEEPEKRTWLTDATNAWRISWVSWLFQSPALLMQQGFVPWISPAVSTLASIPFLVALVGGILAWGLGRAFPVLEPVLGWFLVPPLWILEQFEQIFGGYWARLVLAPVSGYFVLACVVALLTWWWPRPRSAPMGVRGP